MHATLEHRQCMRGIHFEGSGSERASRKGLCLCQRGLGPGTPVTWIHGEESAQDPCESHKTKAVAENVVPTLVAGVWNGRVAWARESIPLRRRIAKYARHNSRD